MGLCVSDMALGSSSIRPSGTCPPSPQLHPGPPVEPSTGPHCSLPQASTPCNLHQEDAVHALRRVRAAGHPLPKSCIPWVCQEPLPHPSTASLAFVSF